MSEGTTGSTDTTGSPGDGQALFRKDGIVSPNYASFPPTPLALSRTPSRAGKAIPESGTPLSLQVTEDVRIQGQPPSQAARSDAASTAAAVAAAAAAVAAMNTTAASASVRDQLWRIFHPTTVKIPTLRSNLYVAEREGVILSRGMILKSDQFPEPTIAPHEEVTAIIATALARHAAEYNEQLAQYEQEVEKYAELLYAYRQNKGAMAPPSAPPPPTYPPWPGFDASLPEPQIVGILAEESSRLALAATGGVLVRSQRILPLHSPQPSPTRPSLTEKPGEPSGEDRVAMPSPDAGSGSPDAPSMVASPAPGTETASSYPSAAPATLQNDAITSAAADDGNESKAVDAKLPSKLLAPHWKSPLEQIFSYYHTLPRASLDFLPSQPVEMMSASVASRTEAQHPTLPVAAMPTILMPPSAKGVVTGGPVSAGSDIPSESQTVTLTRTPSMNAIARAAAAAKVASYLGENMSDGQEGPATHSPHARLSRRPSQTLATTLSQAYQNLPPLPQPPKATSSVLIPTWMAPNFRQIQGFPAAAVAQPSVSGVRAILNMLLTSQYQQQLNQSSLAQQQQAALMSPGTPVPPTHQSVLQFVGGPSSALANVKIHWINLREEAVVYIANRPFVLRDSLRPTKNLRDFDGITGKRLTMVERQLKADILNEARRHGGNILIHDESQNGEVQPFWTSAGLFRLSNIGTEVNSVRGANHFSRPSTVPENLSSFASFTTPGGGSSITSETTSQLIAAPTNPAPGLASALSQTPEEVFNVLSQYERYDVRLHRVPLAANNALRPRDFDALLHAILTSQRDREPNDQILYVFNCQLGRGRSTVGMVVLMLLQSCLVGFPNAIWPHPTSSGVVPPPWLGFTPGPYERRRIYKMVMNEQAQQASNNRTPRRGGAGPEGMPELYGIPNPMATPKAHRQGPPRSTTFPLNQFVAVQNLLRLMIHVDGVAVLREVDHVINVCGSTINLRLDLLHHVKLYESSVAADADVARERALARMRRYLSLLCFHYYLKTMQRRAMTECRLDMSQGATRASSVQEAMEMLSRFAPVFFNLLEQNPFSRWVKHEAGIEAAVWGDEIAKQDRVVANAAAASQVEKTMRPATVRTSWLPVVVLRGERNLVLDTIPDIADISKLSPSDLAVYQRHRPVLGSQVILKADLLPHLGFGGDPVCISDLAKVAEGAADAQNLGITESIFSSALAPSAPPAGLVPKGDSPIITSSMRASMIASDPTVLARVARLYALGIPAFRTLNEAPFAALAQPSGKGIEFLLHSLRKLASIGARSPKTLWINLRDEPVVYIRGIPYVPRLKDHPLLALTNRHDDPEALAALETNLKADIIAEINESMSKSIPGSVSNSNPSKLPLVSDFVPVLDGSLWVHEEQRGRQLKPLLLKGLRPSDIETPQELFDRLRREQHLNVTYHRIPLLPEHAPSAGALDLFMEVLDGPLGGALCERFPDYEQERIEQSRRWAERAAWDLATHHQNAQSQGNARVQSQSQTLSKFQPGSARKSLSKKLSDLKLYERRMSTTGSSAIRPGVEGDWDTREGWESPLVAKPQSDAEGEVIEEDGLARLAMDEAQDKFVVCSIEPASDNQSNETRIVCRPTLTGLADAARVEKELEEEAKAAVKRVMAEVQEAAAYVPELQSKAPNEVYQTVEARVKKAGLLNRQGHRSWIGLTGKSSPSEQLDAIDEGTENQRLVLQALQQTGELDEDILEAFNVSALLLPNVIVNCMKGSRRSTIALVVAMLILVHNRQISIRSAYFSKPQASTTGDEARKATNTPQPSQPTPRTSSRDNSPHDVVVKDSVSASLTSSTTATTTAPTAVPSDTSQVLSSPGIRRVGSYLSISTSGVESAGVRTAGDKRSISTPEAVVEAQESSENVNNEEEEDDVDADILAEDDNGTEIPKPKLVPSETQAITRRPAGLASIGTSGSTRSTRLKPEEEKLVWSFRDSSPFLAPTNPTSPSHSGKADQAQADDMDQLDLNQEPSSSPSSSPGHESSESYDAASPTHVQSPSAPGSFKFLTPARNPRATKMRAVALAVAAAMNLKHESETKEEIGEDITDLSPDMISQGGIQPGPLVNADLTRQLSKVLTSIGSPQSDEKLGHTNELASEDMPVLQLNGSERSLGQGETTQEPDQPIELPGRQSGSHRGLRSTQALPAPEAVMAATVAANAIAAERDQIDHMVRNVTSADAEALAREQQRRGMHTAIIKLTRLLRQGRTVKEETDVVIDVCGSNCNLRDEILAAMQSDEYKTRESTQVASASAARAGALLYSYALLICFNAYLRERSYTRNQHAIGYRAKLTEARTKFAQDVENGVIPETETFIPPPLPPFKYLAFSQWLDRRTEVLGLLESILKNPEEALLIDPNFMHDKHAPVYEGRRGHVLGPGTILKSDTFTNIANTAIRQICEGVINFRIVEKFPVAGTGIPTLSGLVQLLSILTGLELPQNEPVSAKPPYQYAHVVWFNLREEPVLYVDGRPFVLRDFRLPYANVENTGISSQRTEAMEKQLKRDVLAEARRRSNTLLLHDESADGNLYSKEVSIHVSSFQVQQIQEAQPGSTRRNSTSSVVSTTTTTTTEYTLIPGLDVDEQGWPVPGSVMTMSEAFRFAIDLVLRRHKNLPVLEAQYRKELLLASGKYTDPSDPSLAPDEQRERCTMAYYRTPITDEQPPRPEIVDLIVSALEKAHQEAFPECTGDEAEVHPNSKLLIVMNCQMGRGRTTTGMIIASVWCHVRRVYRRDIVPSPDAGDEEVIVAPKLLEATQNLPDPSAPSAQQPSSADKQDATDKEREAQLAAEIEKRKTLLRQGWYSAVSSLLRVLPRGGDAKRLTDIIADRCAKMQNLREVVFEMQELAANSLPGKQKAILHKGKNFLIRYLMLITITSYMLTQAPKGFSTPFSQWLHARAEVRRLFEPSAVKYPEPVTPAMPRIASTTNLANIEEDNDRLEIYSDDEEEWGTYY